MLKLQSPVLFKSFKTHIWLECARGGCKIYSHTRLTKQVLLGVKGSIPFIITIHTTQQW